MLEWHVIVGATVEPGALVVELETPKAIIEVRAGAKAVMRSTIKQAGDWSRTGEPLAVLADTLDESIEAADSAPNWQADFEVT